jgi:hypothetical protein
MLNGYDELPEPGWTTLMVRVRTGLEQVSEV